MNMPMLFCSVPERRGPPRAYKAPQILCYTGRSGYDPENFDPWFNSSADMATSPCYILFDLVLPVLSIAGLLLPVSSENFDKRTVPSPHFEFPAVQLSAIIARSHYIKPFLVLPMHCRNCQALRIVHVTSGDVACESSHADMHTIIPAFGTSYL